MTNQASPAGPDPRVNEADSARLDKLKGIIASGGVPLDELAGDLEDVRALIRSGEARLEAVVLPWGLEFNLVATSSQGPGTPISQPMPLSISPGQARPELAP